MENTSEYPDYITFSGSGEPTLNSTIGDVIDAIKAQYPEQQVAVLTNGTLLYMEEVQQSLMHADLVIPSLDAVSIEAFERILNPHPDITPRRLIDGMVQFRSRFKGRLVIEFFVVPGINDSDTELQLLYEACRKIAPDGIQVNYLDRPGAFDWVKPADSSVLDHVENALEGLPVQIIKRPEYDISRFENVEKLEEKIVSTVERRPSTLDDLVFSLGLRPAEVRKVVDRLVADKKLQCERGERGFFYRLV